MPQTTQEDLKRMFRDHWEEAQKTEEIIEGIRFKERDTFRAANDRLLAGNAAVHQSFEAALEEARVAEKERDEVAAAAAEWRKETSLRNASRAQGQSVRELEIDEGGEGDVTQTFEELKAMRIVAAEEATKLRALRSIMSLHTHIVPISWYEECSETRAYGVLAEPGALQEVDISSDDQFDIVQQMWAKLD